MIGAIDVGSNALRLLIASVDGNHQPKVVESIREPVRLGRDTFTKGVIAEETIERAIEAFGKFRRLMEKRGVEQSRAVATSALREARNRDVVVARVAEASGIDLNVIGA